MQVRVLSGAPYMRETADRPERTAIFLERVMNQNTFNTTESDRDDIAKRTADYVLKGLRDTGVIAADETAVTWRSENGRFVRWAGTDKNLPGTQYVHISNLPYAKTQEDRDFILLNCRVNEDGSPNGAFGDLFAQADSVLTPALQGKFTPAVYNLKFDPGLRVNVLDRKSPVTISESKFPITWASRGTSVAEVVEWSRQTKEHLATFTGGWKG
jgi:hypothetical protein